MSLTKRHILAGGGIILAVAGAIFHQANQTAEVSSMDDPFLPPLAELKALTNPRQEKLDAMTRYWQDSSLIKDSPIRVTTVLETFNIKGWYEPAVEDPRIITTFSLPNKAGGYTRVITLQANLEQEGGRGVTAYYDRNLHDTKDFRMIDPKYGNDLGKLIKWYEANKSARAPEKVRPESRYCLQ
ncbi:MAG TPA: hypothetical protein PKW15_05165 [Alphaproteobacteria bacterium]|nr:hypothetical protein [Rhodospirillaceae bacterium]HRJ12615.1 hypothetical protein [Alphaproteobacteria bacterium]